MTTIKEKEEEEEEACRISRLRNYYDIG